MTKIYQVQKRRGINRRLANRGNFKTLYNKSMTNKSQQLQDNNHKNAIGEQNSEEELDQEEIQDSLEHQIAESGKSDVERSDRIVDANDSFNMDDYDGSLNGSIDDVELHKRNFADMKDDRQIVKIAATNDKFKLVERPRFLFSFDTTTWENKFATSVFRKHFTTELCTYITKAIFDLFLGQALVYSIYKQDQI